MTAIDLKGRVCVVTGSSQGLGMAMARGLAQAGAKVVLTSIDEPNLTKVADGIGRDKCLPLVADITSEADCKRVVAETVKRFGDLEMLVNNARHTGPRANRSILESEPAFWEKVVRTNIYGTYLMTFSTLPHFLKRGGGRVVNITTSLDTMQRRHYSPYGVTKTAIEAETLIWSQDLKDSKIMVNSLIPGGACDTGKVRDHVPSRVGKQGLLPIDVMVPAVVWLASDLSDGHTGGRYVGKLWDKTLAPTEAAAKAKERPVLQPSNAAS
jgi:NAD(P)-dependent dehydrogenase (short-subunit alcohol dehydrogenase family)